VTVPLPDVTPEIRTARLRLRGWREEDREPFAAMNADPVVMEHFVQPSTREGSDAFVDRIVARWRESGFGLWAVERVDQGRFIGFVGLAPAVFEAPFTPAVEVGWRLAAEHWGHGFASEAAREALAYGFTTVGLDEIVSFTAVGNVRSQAVMQRIGLRRDPCMDFDHPSVPEGHPVRRHVFYRLTRARWQHQQT